jgi:hypothetical protein
MTTFGDYIVYVDESGDHSLQSVDQQFPVFVLNFCVFPVVDYVHSVVPRIQMLKFAHFGHDMVVLHEREIRKAKPPFEILLREDVRVRFHAEMNDIIATSRFSVVACVIDKNERMWSLRAGGGWRTKMVRSQSGRLEGYGLKIYP